MSVTVLIPTPLRPSVDNLQSITFEYVETISTITDVITLLLKTYPKLNMYLVDDSGELRKFVNFYVNDIDIRDLDGQYSKITDGDTISIIPAIAGG